jgi:ubiquinone biosynthesis protein COQ4
MLISKFSTEDANLASDSDCASIEPRHDLYDSCHSARTTSIGLLSHRSSTSSATTATSDLQLTPRHSLENLTRYPLTTPLPKKKSLSCNHHPDSSDHLTVGNLQDMISEAERDQTLHSKLEFHVAQNPPNPLPRRLLLPPGPDASYWGEPEIMLSDLDFSSSGGKYSVDKTPFRSRTVLTRTALPILTRTKIASAPRHPYSTTLSTAEGTGGQAKWMMSVLPLALGLSKFRSLPIIRVGSSIVRNVGRVGTAVTALRYTSPVWTRISERSSKNYDGHVPLNWFENTFLAAGSGVIGVADTKRGGQLHCKVACTLCKILTILLPARTDLVALLSETSSQSSMPALHATMRSLPEGRQILHDRPLISSNTINLEQLRTLQRGTLGREWVEWLVEGGVTPDTRHEVAHIDSPVLAYTMTRYRQTHDLYHTLFSLPPTLPYELTLKVLELSNMSLPVAGLSSTFGPFRLSSTRRAVWRADWASWALRQGAQSRPLVGIYWEKRWEQGLGDLRRELGVQRMGDAAVIGRWKAYRQIREAERELRKKGDWIDEPEDW